jgi:hypothetical protein
MVRFLLPLAGVFVVVLVVVIARNRTARLDAIESPDPEDPPARVLAPRRPDRELGSSPPRRVGTAERRVSAPSASESFESSESSESSETPATQDDESDAPDLAESGEDDGLAYGEPRQWQDRDGRGGRADAPGNSMQRWMIRYRMHAAEAARVSARVAAGEAWRAQEYNDASEELASRLVHEIGRERADQYLRRLPLWKVDVATGERFRVDAFSDPVASEPQVPEPVDDVRGNRARAPRR